MADTVRTLAALQALLADNSIGAISPQDIRDMLVSMFGVWGAVYVADGSTSQVGITTTPELLTGFDTDLAGKGMTPDHTSDGITIITDGDYLFISALSFFGSNNITFEVHTAIDTVETDFGTHRKLSAAGDVGSAIILSPLTGLSTGEEVTLFINTTASTGDITLVDAILFALKIS